MCECGCGDYAAFAKMQGPPGIIYAVELHYPCNNGCGTPAGIVIYRFDEAEAKSWEADKLPEVLWTHDETFVPVLLPGKQHLSVDRIRKAMRATVTDSEYKEWFAGNGRAER